MPSIAPYAIIRFCQTSRVGNSKANTAARKYRAIIVRRIRLEKSCRRIALAILMVALVSTLAVGCTKSASVDIKLPSYKVGAVFAVTGNNSSLGTPEKQTVEMMVDQINSKGGINGHKLEVVIYDTKSDTNECTTLVKKLVEQDNVLAVIGPSSSGESLALVDYMNKQQTPLVSAAANIGIVTPVADRKWIFKTPQSDVLAAQEIAAYLTKLNVKKLALLVDASGFGQGGRTVLMAELPKAGFTIVADEKYGVTDPDMTVQLTKIKGTDAQAIVVWGTPPGPAIVAKNAKELKITLPLINSHGIANKSFIDLAGEAANGVVFPAGKLLIVDQLAKDDPQKTVLEQYKKDFETKYGAGTANTFGGHAYDALTIVVNALKAVGADKANIRDYIENNVKNMPGTGGMFTMSAQDHNGLTKGAFVMIKIVDGKWTWLK